MEASGETNLYLAPALWKCSLGFSLSTADVYNTAENVSSLCLPKGLAGFLCHVQRLAVLPAKGRPSLTDLSLNMWLIRCFNYRMNRYSPQVQTFTWGSISGVNMHFFLI